MQCDWSMGGMFIDIQHGNLGGKLPKNNISNASVENFLNELSPIISKMCNNKNNTIITVDKNLDF